MNEVRDKTTYWIENNSAYRFHCTKEAIEVTFYSRVYPLGKIVSDWEDVKVGFGLKC